MKSLSRPAKNPAFGLLRFIFALTLSLTTATALAQEIKLRTLFVLDFELVDSMPEAPFVEKEARLARATAQLREAFIRERFYEVVDTASAQTQTRSARAQYAHLFDCNGCELDLARAAQAERVLVGWVQRVSNLILNINLEVREVSTGKAVLAKSVDLRGNTDESWRRGIDYLVRDMLEKRQGNR